jgi:DNA-binding response OmpR family regulator
MEETCSILLVDDDKSWLEFNVFSLKKFNFKIFTATSLQEALQKLQNQAYDIAVLDLRLVDDDQNNFDGIEIIKRLRKTNATTRILVKSGFLTPDIEHELNELGIDAILDKSASRKDLIAKIDEIHRRLHS